MFFCHPQTNIYGYEDAPLDMFGTADFSASKKIFNMEHLVQQGLLDKESFLTQSEHLMLKAAEQNNILMLKVDDFLIVEPTDRCGLDNMKDYRVYNICWNETKSGINPFKWRYVGVWNVGSSSHSTYRIKDKKEEREKAFKIYWRDKQINSILEDD